MRKNYDVCIIGAGAAGLAAANSLDEGISVCIIDKNEIPGRKILVTGGGRCNLTNEACDRLDMTLDFFHGLGLETRRDEAGRYYPYSGVAADVVKALTDGLSGRDVDMKMGCEATAIETGDGCFAVSFMQRQRDGDGAGKDGGRMETIEAVSLLIAAGGKAAPAFGTTGDGYTLARKLGHKIERTYPILTGIKCPLPDDVAGIRAPGEVRLLEGDEIVASEKGEIQFTKDGISGICVFDMTPYIRTKEGESPEEAFARYRIFIDFAPDFTEEEVRARKDSFGIVTERIARWITPDNLKTMILPVESVWGWDKAQCTGGGVSMDEIDDNTMESAIHPGLFFAGEVLDRQGICGGFNLQNAWESGIIAGRAMSERSKRK